VRWVRSPPKPQPVTAQTKALGEHTDFGSLTVLFNRLGGLQILPSNPDTSADDGGWCYVKPLRGHCVCNLGDAMVKFTAGVLRSNIHRVVDPPGEQGGRTRMSLVYFARPEDQVFLQTLEGSSVIDEKRRGQVRRSASSPCCWRELRLRELRHRGWRDGNVAEIPLLTCLFVGG